MSRSFPLGPHSVGSFSKQLIFSLVLLLLGGTAGLGFLRIDLEWSMVGLSLLALVWAALFFLLPFCRGRFQISLFLLAFFVMLGGAGLSLTCGIGSSQLQNHDEPYLWLGIALTALVAGAVSALRSSRLAFFELFGATLAAGIFFFFQGQFDFIGHLSPTQELRTQFLATVLKQGPGLIYLGKSWLRLLGLAILVTLVLALFSSSLTYILVGTKGLRGYESWVGWRYLLAKRRQSRVNTTAFISILGVGLGVASLIAVTGLMSGYQRDVTERILSSNAHLIVQKYGTDFREHEDIAKKVLQVPGVLASSPFVFNEAMVSTENGLMGIMLKGVDPARISKITNIANQLQDGASLSMLYPKERGGPHTLPGMFVGSEFLKEMQVRVGDVVSLTTPVGISRVKGTTPRKMDFVIAGVFKSGVFEFDQKLVYADLVAAQEFMGLDRVVTGLELKVQNAARVEAVAAKVGTRLGGYPFRTLDWREMNAGIFTALKIQKLVMFLVLIFIIIVAAFNIASTLFMVVVEKSSEIALLKAVGASDASVMKIFMMVGWIIGLIGTVAGVILGIAIAYLLSGAHFQLSAQVYLVDSLSVLLSPLEVAVTAFAALIICHLATIFPSLQAAAVRPAVSLRSE